MGTEEHGRQSIAGLVLFVLIFICGILDNNTPSSEESMVTATPPGSREFRIVAESEIMTLQRAGILDDFSKSTGIPLSIDIKGPIDIRNAVADLKKSDPGDVDAYWPGSMLWLPGSYTVEPESVMKTYVVVAIHPDAAREQGWTTEGGLAAEDLVEAVQAGKIKLAMTSASQSTPGAIFYLGMYTGLTGRPTLTSEELESATTRAQMEAILKKVERSSMDLARLQALFIDDQLSGAPRTNAIVIYESLAIDMNNALIANGAKPMTVFYVSGATAVADAPIRYVDRGNADKLGQYQQLVAFLREPETQERIRAIGWRTNAIGMRCEDCDKEMFNADWGINTQTEFPEMIFPKPSVAMAALNWYQGAGRKPSYTAYCLDYSGSMHQSGHADMVDAMDLLLDPERAAGVLLQPTPQDAIVIYGFSNTVELLGMHSPQRGDNHLRALSAVVAQAYMGKNTALFDCVETALTAIGSSPDPQFAYSVIAMTDGASNEGATAADFEAFYVSNHYSVPVYGIAFGSADFSQLEKFEITGGAVYDGRQDVASAFRKARGNN